jgi:alanine racemase
LPDLPASLEFIRHFLKGSPSYHLTRPGYALYGGNPTPDQDNPMQPVVGLEARIIQLREVEAGCRSAITAAGLAKTKRKLATICLGYADGYPRNARWTEDSSPAARRWSADGPAPSSARVSMDLIIIDVTDIPEADVNRGGAPSP